MAVEAMATERELTYEDVDRLCKRHLARRSSTGLSGYRLVRYGRFEGQRFRPAHPWVSALLLERIDFDRAFDRLEKRHQKVLLAWYGMEKWTQQDIANWLDCTPRTVRRWHREAINALVDEMNG